MPRIIKQGDGVPLFVERLTPQPWELPTPELHRRLAEADGKFPCAYTALKHEISHRERHHANTVNP